MSRKKNQLAAIALAGMMTVNTVPSAAAEIQVQPERLSPAGYSGTLDLMTRASKLTMHEEVSITSEPEDITVAPGSPVHFSIEASGEGLTYQWYYKLPKESEFTLWGGRNTAEFDYEMAEAKSGMQVYCEVTDSDENTVKSRIITVKIQKPNPLKEEPSDITITSGEIVHFALVTEGEGLTYKWFFKMANQNEFSEWAGRNTAAFDYEAPDNRDGMQIYCEITDADGDVTTTRVFTLNIKPAVAIVREPEDVTVQSGETCTFSLEAEGENLKYQWYFRLAGETQWQEWAGRTLPTFTYEPADEKNGMQLHCVVTGKGGKTVSSKVITLTIEKELVITRQPEDVTIESGEDVTFTVEASGSGQLKYQWYYKYPDMPEWTLWTDRNNPTLTYSPADNKDGMQVYCVVTDSNGKSVTSETATLTINIPIPLTIIQEPEDVTIQAGEKAFFSIQAEGRKLKYQWYYQLPGQENFIPMKWKMFPNMTYNPESFFMTLLSKIHPDVQYATAESKDGTQILCVVKDDQGATVTSRIVTLHVESATPEPEESSQEESSEESSEIIEESSEESSEIIEESSEESSEVIEESSEESSEVIEESSEESSEVIEESSEESSEVIEESSEESSSEESSGETQESGYRETEIDLDQGKMMEIIPAIPASAPDETGRCGKGTKWNYYSQGQILVISGAGSIGSSETSHFPEGVKHVIVKSGVIKIEDQAFAGLQSLSTITLPGTVHAIGAGLTQDDHELFAIFYEGTLAGWKQNVTKPAEKRWDRLVDENTASTYPSYYLICKDKSLIVDN